jgi:hypothetical protein
MKDDQSYRRYSRKGEGRHGATRNDIGDHGLLFRGIVLRLPVRQKLLSLKFDFERAKLACPFESIFEQFPRPTNRVTTVHACGCPSATDSVFQVHSLGTCNTWPPSADLATRMQMCAPKVFAL